MLVLMLIISIPAQAAREVSAKRECAACHIAWLDEFKRKDIKALIPYEPKPVTSTGKQDVSSTERMCFSCHDGFMLDSREMWSNTKHGHPVGMKPSKKVKIPKPKGKTVFPLNEDGKVYCGTCHTAHGVDWESKESPIFMRDKNVNSSLCMACHLEKGTGPKEGNHPVFKKPKKIPQELIKAGSRFASDDSVICQSCHRAHGGVQKRMLVKSNVKGGLCHTCHADKKNIVNSKHNMALMAPEATNMHGDTAVDKGTCSACHVPHGGQGPGLWSRTLAEKESDKTAAMCTSCHNKEGLAKEKLTGSHSHPLNLKLDKLGIKVSQNGWYSKHSWAQEDEAPMALPVYDTNGQRTHKQGKISCATCHDPHNWSVIKEKQQPDDIKNTDGDGNSSFLRIAQGKNSALCLNCHIDKRPMQQTSHNMNHLEEVVENEQSSRDKSLCIHCHDAHNAKGPTLRGRERKPTTETEKQAIESWCTDCHNKEGVAKEKIISAHSHPLGDTPENLDVNAHLPLFDKQGKRTKENGVMDCATCHNPHLWTTRTAKPEKKKITQEGDTSNSYLRIGADNNARLCTSCHKDKKLVQGTDHDIKVIEASAKNKLTGTCGACHTVHNPEMEINLWALKPGGGNNPKEQQCRSCHNQEGVAKDKIPPETDHPQDVMVWSGASRVFNKRKIPDTPVYDEDGNDAHSGVITCTSCHNPHQWDPRKAVAGKGKNQEGNALNSFLRNSNSENIVCADCHGRDGLFRYKYFHGKTSRKDYPLYR